MSGKKDKRNLRNSKPFLSTADCAHPKQAHTNATTKNFIMEKVEIENQVELLQIFCRRRLNMDCADEVIGCVDTKDIMNIPEYPPTTQLEILYTREHKKYSTCDFQFSLQIQYRYNILELTRKYYFVFVLYVPTLYNLIVRMHVSVCFLTIIKLIK